MKILIYLKTKFKITIMNLNHRIKNIIGKGNIVINDLIFSIKMYIFSGNCY